MKNTQILLAKRPDGMVKNIDFNIVNSDIPTINKEQLLIKIQYISLDPAIRGWVNACTTYIDSVHIGGVMRTFSPEQIIESKPSDFYV